MIRSFGDKRTEALFQDEVVRQFQGFARPAKRKLDAVNAASRLEALTKDKGCQLIVAAEVLAHAGLGLDLFPREDVAIRGLSAQRSVALIGRARDLPDIPEPQAQLEDRPPSP